VLGAVRGWLGDGAVFALFIVFALVLGSAFWVFTAWFLLLGQVRWRALIPGGVITGVALSGYAVSANVWMPNVVLSNQKQFGFFGVALAIVTWFSGAATCLLVGACAGPVLAEDPGRVGTLIRGQDQSVLVQGAPPSLPAPTRGLHLRDAFRPPEEDVEHL
jgi:membrane protein